MRNWWQQIRSIHPTVKVLGAISFMNDLASEMIYPLMPAFMLTLAGASKTSLGILEGTAESIASLVKLWAGGRSDRMGARWGFIAVGYGLAAIARPLLAFATIPLHVVGLRAFDRFGKGVRTAPRDALIANVTPSELRGQAFGFHQAMDHLGAALGPLMAAGWLWYAPDSLRTIFLFTMVPGFMVMLLVFFALREPPDGSGGKAPVEFRWNAFDRSFYHLMLVNLCFALANSSDMFLLNRAQELGLPIWLVPIVWSVFSFLKSFASLVTGRIVDQFGSKQVLMVGLLTYAGAYLLMGNTLSLGNFLVSMMIYGLICAGIEPAHRAIIAGSAVPERRGSAFGIAHLIIGFAAFPASFIFGLLADRYGPHASFAFSASAAGLAAIILASWRPSKAIS